MIFEKIYVFSVLQKKEIQRIIKIKGGVRLKPFFQDKKEGRIHRFEALYYAPHLHSALEIGFLTEGESLQPDGTARPLGKNAAQMIFVCGK